MYRHTLTTWIPNSFIQNLRQKKTNIDCLMRKLQFMLNRAVQMKKSPYFLYTRNYINKALLWLPTNIIDIEGIINATNQQLSIYYIFPILKWWMTHIDASLLNTNSLVGHLTVMRSWWQLLIMKKKRMLHIIIVDIFSAL